MRTHLSLYNSDPATGFMKLKDAWINNRIVIEPEARDKLLEQLEAPYERKTSRFGDLVEKLKRSPDLTLRLEGRNYLKLDGSPGDAIIELWDDTEWVRLYDEESLDTLRGILTGQRASCTPKPSPLQQLYIDKASDWSGARVSDGDWKGTTT